MPQELDYAHDHQVRLLQGAQELFPALIAAMDAALSDIQFETYIFDFMGAAASVAEALMRAARRGVHTHLVVDGVGTGRLPQDWADRMRAAGVLFRVYSPLGPLGLMLPHRWRRLHRKLCVVDGRLLFCGGINVLDDYHDPNHGPLAAPRFDFAVEATGSLVDLASDAMEQLWWRMPGGKLRRALVLAARRGVRVRLLLQGRYEYFMQYHAARPVYGALLAAGVEIHEYEPSFLHAKVAVIDAQGARPWATVGSSNLDPLSLLLAREANVVVEDAAFAADLRRRLDHAMRHEGRSLDPARYAGRSWRARALDRMAFMLMRLALWLTGNRY